MSSKPKTISVVLADDHKVLRDSLEARLAMEPDIIVVGTAGDGRSAIEVCRRCRPDVLIMDIGMPELNGIDATRQVVQELDHTRVLCLSVHDEGPMVAAMLRAGAMGYVPKVAAADELVQALRTVAAGQTYLSPRVSNELVEYGVRGKGDSHSGAYQELSPREREVLQLVAEGHDTQAIASRLHISPKTVLSHRQRLMTKLGVDTTASLTRYAIREGVIRP